MAAELTFSPGYVPGLNRTARRPERKEVVHAGAPVSPTGEFAPPMTAEQRRALAALIHTPAGATDLRFSRDRAGARIVWAVVTASVLAWTLTIAAALLPETKLVGSMDVPRVAMPHVTEGGNAAV
ncbi:MAG: hypothetical protein ABW218_10925 [Casimicrobiaceae bacterium]